MNSFDEYMNEEASNNGGEELVEAIKKEFKKVFPNGWIKGGMYKAGLSRGNVSISFGLIGNHNELTSKILMNDPMYHSFLIYNVGDGKWEAKDLQSGISVNPSEGSYLAMQHIKTKWRKTTGDAAKIEKTFKRFFGRMKDLIKEHGDNVYMRKNYSDKYFKV